MKKTFALLLLATLLFSAGCNQSTDSTTTAAVTEAPVVEESATDKLNALAGKLDSPEAIELAKALAWDEYVESVKQPIKLRNGKTIYRKDEIQRNKTTEIKIGTKTMKVMTKVVGSAPEGGYPLFLVYHGGGYDPSGETNESQWKGMAERYAHIPGIYCSIRSISDNESSGQIFSTAESWEFYDRIIEDCIVFMNANPNQVYIVGYSAGGNGVYQIAPRITDRLAAATMTAGHPEGIDLTNLFNLPFYLQVGELDTAYSRHTITVEYCQKLDDLAARKGGGYIHECFVHAGTQHGLVGDNKSSQTVIADLPAWLNAQQNGTAYTGGTKTAETHAAKLMTTHTRDPIPTRVIWNLTTTKDSNAQRGLTTFYWLSTEATGGAVDISYDKSTNTITVKTCTIRGGALTVYLNEDMVDLFKPVTIKLPSGKEITFTPEISVDVIRKTTQERGDKNYQFCAAYTFYAQ